MTASILVTDGEQRAALAVVRALGRAGHRVYACSARRRSLAGASRYARREARVPDPLADPDSFVQEVEALIRRWRTEVLLPVTEASLLALLPARRRLADVRLPFASLEGFRRISDKAVVLESAQALGIATPRQWVLNDSAAADSLEDEGLSFPLVVKPTRSVIEVAGRRWKLGARHAPDRERLLNVLTDYPASAYPLLLQQRIEGPGVGVFLLLWDGELRAAFAHRRIREKPPGGGVSVYRESVPPDPALVSKSRALLERFDWQGVAMVEYKIDARSGTPYLMEVNGRFWGSLQLAVDAGVDFPTLLVAAAIGRPAAPVTDYRAGVRSRWWWGDVDHLLARLRRSPAELGLPPGAGGAGRALRDFLMLWRPGDRNEILRLDDPLPFARESADWVRSALNGKRTDSRSALNSHLVESSHA